MTRLVARAAPVEAGAVIWLELRDHSTWPDWSATSADTPEPSEADDSTPLSALSRPELVGPSAGPATGAIAGLDPTSGRLATWTGLSLASRGGSMCTNVRPAANVNTLIRASVSKATPRVLRSTTHPPFAMQDCRKQDPLRQGWRGRGQSSQPSTP